MDGHAADAVARSIEEFGWRQPIVADEQGVIVMGHTRLKAAQKLGLENVPVHVAKGLSPEQAKALQIADNKTYKLSNMHPTYFSCVSKAVAVMDRRRSGSSVFQLDAMAASMAASSVNTRLLGWC